VQVAKSISDSIDVEHIFFEQFIPAPDVCLSLLQDYIGHTMVRLPASHFVKLQYYSQLYNQHKIVIDGGQGEIFRCEFFNRMLFYGKKHLQKGDFEKIYPLIFRQRASIFDEDILRAMKENTLSEIKMLRDRLPSIQEIGVEHWLDLFIIRYGFVNTTNLEQARSDTELINFMPFAQPSLLRRMFDVQISERQNGKLMREIVKQNDKKLAKYPCVKNGVILPFGLSTILARVWLNVMARIGRCYHYPTQIQFLESMSEFVQDTVNSSRTKNCELYDYPKILKIVTEFYGGKKQLAGELDWWLAFEIWRQRVYDN
jgi:hypothetical protein